MELLEKHAVDTYSTFVNENRERLRQLPPPSVARSYYTTGDLYLFDDFQVSRQAGTRRPPCNNLLDVFTNICMDEGEHVKTMIACQDYALYGTRVVSPHLNYKKTDMDEKREKWRAWSEQVNDIYPSELDWNQEWDQYTEATWGGQAMATRWSTASIWDTCFDHEGIEFWRLWALEPNSHFDETSEMRKPFSFPDRFKV